MSEKNRLEEMQRTARDVADILVENLLGVVEVGQIGSVARGKGEPNDIDLIVFTTDDEVPDLLLVEAESGSGSLYPSVEESCWDQVLYDLGADAKLVRSVEAVLGGKLLHIVLMPSAPDDLYLGRFIAASHDPCFLEHAAADFQRYNRESGEFTTARAPWQDYLDFVLKLEAGEQSEGRKSASVSYRPYYGLRQVRSQRGIKRGLILKEGPGRRELVILTAPYDRKGDYVFDYAVLGKSGFYTQRAYCTDRGLMRGVGGWNRTNYLLRTGRRRLSEEEIRAIEAAVS